MLKTRFCEHFGIDAPIVVAPMGPDLTGVELVAAVSRAGGFGILQAQPCPPERLRDEIRRLRTLTSSPFGVNFVLHFPHEDGIRVCVEEGSEHFRCSGATRRHSSSQRIRLTFPSSCRWVRWAKPFGPPALEPTSS